MLSRALRSSAIAATRHTRRVGTRQFYRLPVFDSVKQNSSTFGTAGLAGKRDVALGKTLGYVVGAVIAITAGGSVINNCISLPLMELPSNIAVCQGNEAAKDWNSNWDNRAGNGTKGYRRLIFVRHGAYNAAANDKGRTLNTVGRIQACETGLRIAHVYGKADRLVFSTMVRATETSEIIKDVLTGLNVEPNTIESDDSIREGQPIEPIPNPTNWGDAASFERDGARIEAAFRKHVHRADAEATGQETTIFVCHGNVIRYFTMRALQLNPSAWLRTTVANGSITEIYVLPDGRVSLQKFGDSGHMKPVLVTS